MMYDVGWVFNMPEQTSVKNSRAKRGVKIRAKELSAYVPQSLTGIERTSALEWRLGKELNRKRDLLHMQEKKEGAIR